MILFGLSGGCCGEASGLKGVFGYSQVQMGFDQSKIGQVVAAQMEALEGRYGDECEIGNVCTIVEVLGPHGSDVSVRSSEARPHTTIGLLRMAEAMMLNRLGGVTRGEDE